MGLFCVNMATLVLRSSSNDSTCDISLTITNGVDCNFEVSLPTIKFLFKRGFDNGESIGYLKLKGGTIIITGMVSHSAVATQIVCVHIIYKSNPL